VLISLFFLLYFGATALFSAHKMGRKARVSWGEVARVELLNEQLTCEDMVFRTALTTGKTNLEALPAMAAHI
jgi:hypothetical protein